MQLDLTSTTTTDLANSVDTYSVSPKSTDSASSPETRYNNPNFTKYYGYYMTIPELNSTINALATWVLGQGYVCDGRTKILLKLLRGWGEDTFLSILWNLLVTKKVNGDAFAEIITDGKTILKGGTLINLKPLDPSKMTIVCNAKGRITGYEQRTTSGVIKYKPEEIFHISNNRVADNIHGQSMIEPVEWTCNAWQEALADKRRILHRSTIRVMEVDEDDTTRLSTLKTQYANAINSGEVLLVPKGTGALQDLTAPTSEHLEWIRYLENKFYQELGVPKVILGGTSENTEASSKVSVIVYEPIFTREITELEMDIVNQLGLEVKFNKQPSLMDNMQTDEAKNTGQVGFQPNDVTYGSGK